MPASFATHDFSVELKINGTPLPGDAYIQEFVIREALSQPFEIDIEIAYGAADTPPALGATLSLKMQLPDRQWRFWNAYIAGVSLSTSDSGTVNYRLRGVPKLWFLSRRSDCRIFNDQSTMEVIKSVLGEAGITVKDTTSGGREQRPWCAQYRETDLNFLNRLLEDAGVCYYFEHSGESDAMLVLADSLSGHACFPGGAYDTVGFGGYGSQASVMSGEQVADWTEHQLVTSGKYQLGDYPFDKAQKDEEVATGKSASHAFAGYGITDFHTGGEFGTGLKGVLADRAKVRIEELQAHRCRKFGQGSIRGIAAGSLFTLAGHPVSSQNVQHLVVSAKHSASAPDPRSGSAGHEYNVSFEAIPADLPFRPERVTPMPAVDGLHTAVVLDNDGSGCQWSKAGPMVKIRFFWNSEQAAGWARVAQPNASNSFGTLFLPQVGDEVVVSFLEGDPDHPLVIGSVYNGSNKPFSKYAQSKQPKQTGLRTSSGHELTFDEDVKKVYFESSQDLEVKVAKQEKRDCDTFMLTAQTSIELKVGQSSIKMEASKITISSMAVDIKGDGGDVKISGLNVEASGDVGAKVKGGATAELSGGAQTTVKGAMVMIN